MDIEKIRPIIENDCKIQFEYKDEDGETCAIGALLEQTPLNIPEKLLKNGNTGIMQFWNIVGKALEEEFGIREDQAINIQELNDEYNTPEERRSAIMTYIEENA